MRAVITVIGCDTIGIIAAVTRALADHAVNILDIRQTTMREYFTMMMLVDLEKMGVSFAEMEQLLHAVGGEKGVEVRMQREQIFTAMHRV
jgi:ACT domain-containing protein